MPSPKEPITSWGKRLRRLRKEAKLSQLVLSQRSGVTQAAISDIEIGVTSEPEMGTWDRLMVALGQPAGSGHDLVDQNIPVIALAAAGQSGERRHTDQGLPVGAGSSYVGRPSDVKDPHAFAVEVDGDSMVPRYDPGQIVVADPSKYVGNGDYCVIGLHTGERYVKRWMRGGGRTWLESVNPAYEPIPVKSGQVQFAYKIVWVKEK